MHIEARPLVVAAALFSLASGWATESARAASEIAFTVGSYPVDAVAASAVKAKEKALADGQQAAFRALLKRIVPVTAYPRLKRLQGVRAADYGDGFSVRSERNSSTRYIASLDFAFRAQGVRDLLNREGVPFVDSQAPKVLLVPVLSQGGKFTGGSWADAWKGLDLEHTLTPVEIAPLKPEIHADTIKMVMEGRGGAERILATEYKADQVVLAVAEVDASTNKLLVSYGGTDAVGPLVWKRGLRIADGDLAYTMELASVIGLGVLEGRWKAVEARAAGGVGTLAGGGEPVTMQVEFEGIAEWNDIRRRLLGLPGIDGVEVGGVTARSADLSLRYPGGGARLADALAAQGMTLRNFGGTWVLRSSF